MTVDAFLSQEFIEFSTKIAELRDLRAQKQKEIQDFIQVAKKELAEIDVQANNLIQKFEEFKNTKK